MEKSENKQKTIVNLIDSVQAFNGCLELAHSHANEEQSTS